MFCSRESLMKAIVCHTIVLILLTLSSQAETVNATWNAATDVPVTASSYAASGNTVNFTLNFAPEVGTELMVVRNTGLAFINGTFSNLTQGQAVPLIFGGVTYHFVANYYGGTGNDLVLSGSPPGLTLGATTKTVNSAMVRTAWRSTPTCR